MAIKAKKSIPVWVWLLGVVVLLGLWVMSAYNGLVAAQTNVQNAWAQVQTEYQRRFDLIPNLQAIVEGAADFEKSTLVEVTEARTQWLNAQSTGTTADQITAAQNLDGALSRLLVSVEAYPTLTATDSFKTFQVQMEGTENRVTVARQDYNDAATAYNLKIRTFPTNVVAGAFNFEASDLFEAATGADTAPTVNFDFNSSPTTETQTTNQ